MSLDTTQHISSLVTEISHATKIIQDSDAAKESARKTALAAAKTLTAALENPQEVIYQHAFSVSSRQHFQILNDQRCRFWPDLQSQGSWKIMREACHLAPHLSSFGSKRLPPRICSRT